MRRGAGWLLAGLCATGLMVPGCEPPGGEAPTGAGATVAGEPVARPQRLPEARPATPTAEHRPSDGAGGVATPSGGAGGVAMPSDGAGGVAMPSDGAGGVAMPSDGAGGVVPPAESAPGIPPHRPGEPAVGPVAADDVAGEVEPGPTPTPPPPPAGPGAIGFARPGVIGHGAGGVVPAAHVVPGVEAVAGTLGLSPPNQLYTFRADPDRGLAAHPAQCRPERILETLVAVVQRAGGPCQAQRNLIPQAGIELAYVTCSLADDVPGCRQTYVGTVWVERTPGTHHDYELQAFGRVARQCGRRVEAVPGAPDARFTRRSRALGKLFEICGQGLTAEATSTSAASSDDVWAY